MPTHYRKIREFSHEFAMAGQHIDMYHRRGQKFGAQTPDTVERIRKDFEKARLHCIRNANRWKQIATVMFCMAAAGVLSVYKHSDTQELAHGAVPEIATHEATAAEKRFYGGMLAVLTGVFGAACIPMVRRTSASRESIEDYQAALDQEYPPRPAPAPSPYYIG